MSYQHQRQSGDTGASRKGGGGALVGLGIGVIVVGIILSSTVGSGFGFFIFLGVTMLVSGATKLGSSAQRRSAPGNAVANSPQAPARGQLSGGRQAPAWPRPAPPSSPMPSPAAYPPGSRAPYPSAGPAPSSVPVQAPAPHQAPHQAPRPAPTPQPSTPSPRPAQPSAEPAAKDTEPKDSSDDEALNSLPPAMREQVVELRRRGRMIEAIDLLRDHAGMELYDASQLVLRIRR